MPTEHDCLECVRYHEADSRETHGERFLDEWWECPVCGARFTDAEIAELEEQNG